MSLTDWMLKKGIAEMDPQGSKPSDLDQADRRNDPVFTDRDEAKESGR